MLANHHETREYLVVYVSLEKGSINVRELDSKGKDSWSDWVDPVTTERVDETKVILGVVGVRRFSYLGPTD